MPPLHLLDHSTKLRNVTKNLRYTSWRNTQCTNGIRIPTRHGATQDH